MKFMHKAAKKWQTAREREREREREKQKQANGPSKVANKSGDKATTKSNTKVPKTRHNKWGGRIAWGMAKRIRIIYSPKEAKWSVVFVAAALTLSNAVEIRRETDARESALPFDRSCCSYIQHLSLSRTTHIEFQRIPTTNCTTNGMSNSSSKSNNKSKQCRAQAVQCTACTAARLRLSP